LIEGKHKQVLRRMTNTNLADLCDLDLNLSAFSLNLGIVNRMTRRVKRESVIRGCKNLSKTADKMAVRSEFAALRLKKLFQPVYAAIDFPN
jgi:hypothetical protein